MRTNPLIERRVQLLEDYLDTFTKKEKVSLKEVKKTFASRYIQNHYDASYRFHTESGYSFFGRLYWVEEHCQPVPYFQIELGLITLPSQWNADLMEYLLDINRDLSDPVKIAMLDHTKVGLILRGRIDKVAPDYWEALVGDLAGIGNELLDRLRSRYGFDLTTVARAAR